MNIEELQAEVKKLIAEAVAKDALIASYQLGALPSGDQILDAPRRGPFNNGLFP